MYFSWDHVSSAIVAHQLIPQQHTAIWPSIGWKFHVTILAPRISRWLIDFWKMCASLIQNVR